jgi:hypothetical protein
MPKQAQIGSPAFADATTLGYHLSIAIPSKGSRRQIWTTLALLCLALLLNAAVLGS